MNMKLITHNSKGLIYECYKCGAYVLVPKGTEPKCYSCELKKNRKEPTW